MVLIFKSLGISLTQCRHKALDERTDTKHGAMIVAEEGNASAHRGDRFARVQLGPEYGVSAGIIGGHANVEKSPF